MYSIVLMSQWKNISTADNITISLGNHLHIPESLLFSDKDIHSPE